MVSHIVELARTGHSDASAGTSELRRRMQRPQRHRLLHGYPLAAAMPRISEDQDRDLILPDFDPTPGSPRRSPAALVLQPGGRRLWLLHLPARGVHVEEGGRGDRPRGPGDRADAPARPGLAGRPIAGLYFGGGTANLSPPEPFRKLCRALSQAFDLSGAEVTLEGVPAAFLNRRPLLVDILREELPARHFRLSMGIQTFDRDRLEQMGRVGFGDAGTFREVVQAGHSRGSPSPATCCSTCPRSRCER